MLLIREIFSKSQIAIFVTSTTQNFSICGQKHTEMGSSSHFDYFLASKLFDLNWEGRGFIAVDSQLSSSIGAPSPIADFLTLLNFGNRVVASTPDVSDVIKAYSIKGQA